MPVRLTCVRVCVRRIHVSLEDLMNDVQLVGMLQELLIMSGRASADEVTPP